MQALALNLEASSLASSTPQLGLSLLEEHVQDCCHSSVGKIEPDATAPSTHKDQQIFRLQQRTGQGAVVVTTDITWAAIEAQVTVVAIVAATFAVVLHLLCRVKGNKVSKVHDSRRPGLLWETPEGRLQQTRTCWPDIKGHECIGHN